MRYRRDVKGLLAIVLLAGGCSDGDRAEQQPTVPKSITAESLDPSGKANPEAKRLAMISNVARQICSEPATVGFRRTIQGGVEGEISVPGVIRKFADVGANVQVKGSRADWAGVLQKDLAAALRDSNSCRQQVFQSLLATFRVSERPRVPENLFEQLAIGSQIGAAERLLGEPFLIDPDGQNWRMYRLLDGRLSLVLHTDEGGAISCVAAWDRGNEPLEESLNVTTRYFGRTDLLFGRTKIDINRLPEQVECLGRVEHSTYQNISYAATVCRDRVGVKPAHYYVLGTTPEPSFAEISPAPAALNGHRLTLLAYYAEPENGETPGAEFEDSCLAASLDHHSNAAP
jgi:hypothetical protein